MNKLLDAITAFMMVVGLGIMGTGIIGNIALQLEWINVSGDIIMLVPIGFLITFVGGIMSLGASNKEDALVSDSEVRNSKLKRK